MLIQFINYGMPILFIIGAVICYITKSQKEDPLYQYGYWAFVVFFVSRLISLAQPFMLSPEIEQEIATAGMPFWITALNLFRELLGIVAFLILVLGFYKSLENEKSKNVQKQL